MAITTIARVSRLPDFLIMAGSLTAVNWIGVEVLS